MFPSATRSQLQDVRDLRLLYQKNTYITRNTQITGDGIANGASIEYNVSNGDKPLGGIIWRSTQVKYPNWVLA